MVKKSKKFSLESTYLPNGDQPEAIHQLELQLKNGKKHQVLLGVTGSGKTFTMACIIDSVQKPALILAHNKTLAAQLYNEFKLFFPNNAVEYFVSYYDYYQPEAYIPQSATYIEKDASVNDEIDMLRHSATMALLERKDVIIVASVSCIYGLGSPEEYKKQIVMIEEGYEIERDTLIERLVAIQYQRNNIDFSRGTFRINGDIVEIFPPYAKEHAVRIEFFGDDVERISKIDPLTGRVITRHKRMVIYPNSHYATSKKTLKHAIQSIEQELAEHVPILEEEGKLVEAQRLSQRTAFDLEMMREVGFCNGIENYSRHLTGRKPGEAPPTLLDYFPKDFVLFIDESHATVPQVRGMFAGDRSRKETLIEHGFRLPSALDNRPLNFDEFSSKINQVIFVSATPAPYELEKSGGVSVEQVVRPTGLLDPKIEIRPAKEQVDDLLEEIRKRAKINEKVLVTTLTKRFSEDLTAYYTDIGVRVRYLHSDIKTLERMKIIRELRLGEFDVLIGINLLREGLDIPEVSLVAILDADKEGFLRSETSLIQTAGRAARNLNGHVLMYADKITRSMKSAMDETERRRTIQDSYNKKHGQTPKSIQSRIHDDMSNTYDTKEEFPMAAEEKYEYLSKDEVTIKINTLKPKMYEAAELLDFETAAKIRDTIRRLQKKL